MKISTKPQTLVRRSNRNVAQSTPTEQTTLGTDLVHIGTTVGAGIGGAIPLVGAGVNGYGFIGTGFANEEVGMAISGAGAVANVAGTITAGVGLFIGNDMVTKVGAGLLAGSGVAAGLTWGLYT